MSDSRMILLRSSRNDSAAYHILKVGGFLFMSLTAKSLGLVAAIMLSVPAFAYAGPVASSFSSSQWLANHSTAVSPNPGAPSSQHSTGHWAGKHHKGCGVMKQLNLTPEQKAQMKAKREAFRGQMQASGKTWKDLSKDERMARRQLMKREFMAILTPDQAKQFETLKSQCGRSKGRDGKPPEQK
jgi:Spy/CpxP family protein refolding chaperone